MTTEEKIITAPTERSIPAVRITSDCAAPTMPMMATYWSISVRAKGEKNCWPGKSPENQDRGDQHDRRHHRGRGVENIAQPGPERELPDCANSATFSAAGSASLVSSNGSCICVTHWRDRSCSGYGSGGAPGAHFMAPPPAFQTVLLPVSPSRDPCLPAQSADRTRQPACQ